MKSALAVNMLAQVCFFIACAVASAQAGCEYNPYELLSKLPNNYDNEFNYGRGEVSSIDLPYGSGSYAGVVGAPEEINYEAPYIGSPEVVAAPVGEIFAENVNYRSSPYAETYAPAPIEVVTAPTRTNVIDLPAPPAPRERVLSNACSCRKTIVKPQVYQREVRIPILTKYIQKKWVPVVEKIKYSARGQTGEEPSSRPCSSRPIIEPVPAPCAPRYRRCPKSC